MNDNSGAKKLFKLATASGFERMRKSMHNPVQSILCLRNDAGTLFDIRVTASGDLRSFETMNEAGEEREHYERYDVDSAAERQAFVDRYRSWK